MKVKQPFTIAYVNEPLGKICVKLTFATQHTHTLSTFIIHIENTILYLTYLLACQGLHEQGHGLPYTSA